VGCACHADGSRDGARARQHHFHLDTRRAAAGESASIRPHGWIDPGGRNAHCIVVVDYVGNVAYGALLHRARKEISGRDLILLAGGLFLLWKSVREIHGSLEGNEHVDAGKADASYLSVVGQIAIIDIVFSLDSVITAVGLVDDVAIMIIAILLAVGLMMFGATAVSRLVAKHPTIKMLALSFLVLVGFTLVAEGWGFHIPKGYIYFAMAFAVGVELLNVRIRRRQQSDS
jgi:predicted tellurium resistance membrane protein TerC